MPPKKKGREEGVNEDERQIVACLQSGQALAPAQKLQLVKADVGVCSDRCKGNKSNPNCMCGWIPTEGAHKKKGLWQKDPGILSSLGTDPRVNLRGVR